jgi:hypothetical protein
MSSALLGEMEFSWLFDQALVLQCSGQAAISAFHVIPGWSWVYPGNLFGFAASNTQAVMC